MSQSAAYFDFDGTLIDGYSAKEFLTSRWKQGALATSEMLGLLRASRELRAGKVEFDHFMRVGVQSFRGHDPLLLESLGNKLFSGQLGGMLFTEMVDVIAAHRRAGRRLVIASSALRFQVQSLADDLGFDDILCTDLEVVDGLYTGRVNGPSLWGSGKAAAVREHAAANGIDLSVSYAYGNGDEDLEYLESVGHPHPVNPDPELERIATERNWPIVRCRPRAGRPGALALGRTVAAYGGMAAAFGTGYALSRLGGSKRQGVDFTARVGSDAALALAGIHVNIQGQEIADTARPGIFIFNHQSILDGLVVLKVMRRDITGVGKKELGDQPGVGQFMRWADIAFLDRKNTASAVEAMAPVVQRLQDGLSILIAPEGTRSPTTTLGPFKKGAFRMAMQGGVPIVPIVIRGAGELLWRGSQVMRPGTIDVRVLEPIDVSDWTLDDLEERIAGVRQLYLDTLENWPVAPQRLLDAALS